MVPKNTILTEAGRSPWYRTDGTPLNAYLIGISGGSASGKTRVAQQILKKLAVPWVLVISQDSFYNSLTPDQSKRAFKNEHDFDSPGSFDYELLRQCLIDLKASRSVQIPNYSFVLHQRTAATSYLYGAGVVIIEGLFVLHDAQVRDLLDLKIFVQCDSDIMLARRLRRDVVERGRDPAGILDQYLRFVKPSFDNFILPTSRYADVIVPGMNNQIAVDLIVNHIRQQLDERKQELRKELFKANVDPAAFSLGVGGASRTEKDGGECAETGLPDTVFALEQTPQIRGIQTILRDQTTSIFDFIFHANRLSTLVIEHALTLLPTRSKPILTGTHIPCEGKELAVDAGHLCGVSILRSGASLEKGLRRVLRDVAVGSVLIQSCNNGEPLLYHVELPEVLTLSKESAAQSFVLLLDSQIGTGAAALMAVRVLLDHGVLESHIIFCCMLVSRVGGIWALRRAFSGVRIVSSTVDDGLEERWVWPTDPYPKHSGREATGRGREGERGPKKVFAITPGLGDYGSRYYGC